MIPVVHDTGCGPVAHRETKGAGVGVIQELGELADSAAAAVTVWLGGAMAKGASDGVSERVSEVVGEWLDLDRGEEIKPSHDELAERILAEIAGQPARQQALRDALSVSTTQSVEGRVEKVKIKGDNNHVAGVQINR